MSLTQQALALILMMLAFLSFFFFFFLNDNINSTISRQIFSIMSSAQTPVARALSDGKTVAFEQELFQYLASGSEENMGLVTDEGTAIFAPENRKQTRLQEEFQEQMLLMATSMLKDPSIQRVEKQENFKGMEVYYRLDRIDTKNGSAILYTYMDGSYASQLRSALVDSTVYVTLLAFFLILMVFVFWVFSIIHPLNQIKNYIAQIKQGKEVDLYVNRDDEIGAVANELRTLTAELAKQEKSKEEMIHNISHDLKTPIATIKSYSESIKDGIYPYGDLDSSVDVIYSNAQRLEDKVNSLLYMNRVEYLVTSDAEGVVTNMKEVVEQVVLNSVVIRPEIEIETDVEEVFFDGLMESWRVCIENIMENAFRYAKSYIRIEVHENELRISNDGPKMPEDRISSLFRPYVKGEGGKFGLGLSIVSKVVAANKYKVEGMNTEDGVCFRIYRDVPKPKQNKFMSGSWNASLTNRGSWGSRQKNRENAGKDEKSRNEARQNRDRNRDRNKKDDSSAEGGNGENKTRNSQKRSSHRKTNQKDAGDSGSKNNRKPGKQKPGTPASQKADPEKKKDRSGEKKSSRSDREKKPSSKNSQNPSRSDSGAKPKKSAGSHKDLTPGKSETGAPAKPAVSEDRSTHAAPAETGPKADASRSESDKQ